MKERTLGLAGLCALPLLSVAATESDEWRELVLPVRHVEAGIAFGSGAAKNIVNTGGLNGSGLFGIGSFSLGDGRRYDADTAVRWRFSGDDLGLPTRRVDGEYGQQGLYRIEYGYQELRRWGAAGFQTPLLGAGSNNLTLPANLTARTAAGPSALPALATTPLQSVAVGSERRRERLGFLAELDQSWRLRASYHHDVKQGIKPTGAASGSAGGSSLTLPEPLHAVTERWEGSLEYAREGRHLALVYQGSAFHNDIKSLAFQNPFSNGSLDNRLGTPPDNQAHRLKLEGGLRWSPTGQIAGSLAAGRMTQDQNFLPYSTSAASAALPVASLHGRVDTRAAHLRLAGRPLRDLGLTATYRYDERDNRTPVNAYTRTSYEVGGNSTASNLPYGRRLAKLALEADYALRSGSNLRLAAEDEAIRRTCGAAVEPCSEVGRTQEDTLRAELRQRFSPTTSGRLAILQASRHGSQYTTLTAAADVPGMRKYFLADRERSGLGLSIRTAPEPALSLGGSLDINDDRYTRSQYGLTRSRNVALNFDGSLAFSEDFSLHAFATFEDYRSRLDGNYASAVAGGLAVERTDANWAATARDHVDTLGAGIKRVLLSGRLELEGDLVMSRARTAYDIAGGPCAGNTGACAGNAPSALPTVPTLTHELRLSCQYALDADSAIRVRYAYLRLTNADYALDGIGLATSTRVLGAGEQSPHYAGHNLGLSYILRFR